MLACRNSGMTPMTSPPWSSTDVGDRAHQPDRAAAVDQADALLGEDSSEPRAPPRRRPGRAGAGAAIDANLRIVLMIDSDIGMRRGDCVKP